MDDIVEISIKGEEENYIRSYRCFCYNRMNGKYTFEGSMWDDDDYKELSVDDDYTIEKDGGDGGDLVFSDRFEAETVYDDDEDY